MAAFTLPPTGVTGTLQFDAAALIAKNQLDHLGSAKSLMFFAWDSLKKNPPPGPYNIASVMSGIENSVLAGSVAIDEKNPLLDKVDLLFAEFAEALQRPFLTTRLASPRDEPITGTKLFCMQQCFQARENVALEMIWSHLTTNHEFPPIQGGHRAIRAWLAHPENAPQIQQLLHLDLSNLSLGVLPREIGLFTGLEGLNAANNFLTTLPETIGNLKALKVLILENNQLSSLPFSFFNLTDLNGLSLSGNRFKTLPESVCHLTQLSRLSLAGNLLTTLPPSAKQLTKLNSIDLCANQFKVLPEVLFDLTGLIEILASHNQIATVPSGISQLASLSRLNLSYNQITELPESIGALQDLFMINLLYNKLTELPESLGNLKRLSQIIVGANQITTLPHSLFFMKDAIFHIDSNPIMFISDIVLAESFNEYVKPEKILPYYQQALYYTCHSSLAELFQSIIRNDPPAQIQLAFSKLNIPMQQQIKTAFSEMTPTLNVETESVDLCTSASTLSSSSSTPSSSSSAPAQPDLDMFSDLNRFARALRKAAFDKFERVTPEELARIGENVQKLAAKTGEGWGETNLFDHMLRFIDALEASTGEVAFALSHSTPNSSSIPAHGKSSKIRTLKKIFKRK